MGAQIRFDHTLQHGIDIRHGLAAGDEYRRILCLADGEADGAGPLVVISVNSCGEEDVLPWLVEVDHAAVDLQPAFAQIPDLDVRTEVMIGIARRKGDALRQLQEGRGCRIADADGQRTGMCAEHICVGE